MSAGHAEMSTQMTDLAPGVDTDVFVSRYLAHAASQLPGRDEEWLAGLAPRQPRLRRACAAPGETLLRVTRPRRRHHRGRHRHRRRRRTWSTRCAPSSSARGCPAERVLHPQIVVAARRRRPADARSSTSTTTPTVPEGAIVESWMHIELDDIPADQHDALAARPAPRARPTCTTRSPTRRRCTG